MTETARKCLLTWSVSVVLILAVYMNVALWRYRLRHPDLTETQLFLRMGKILTGKP